ncbi:GAP1-N2 domain-containing protein [Sphaerisporangium aureirubrum]|uniref:GAP1-N2 domain-containing protein n=1 Tax=Sphaerisporangium aureirubrum TaxID=1544736 RepID=UPI00362B624F
MAWQLHYTSAEYGPGGRAGFQFVAESAGVPAGVSGAVAVHLAYRPPPEAPLAPDAAQISALPVALAYGPAGDMRVLTRCVYLGRDYSGRYGNFLGHAVVAAADELMGLRPVEFWRAALWTDAPATPGTVLPELTELTPGDHLDPDSLGEWLASGGEPGYARLAALLQIVGVALSRGHGRLVLVAADTGRAEEIVRWIGVISYSLPWPVAGRLTFLTYSADPATAQYVIVGTTPDVWIPSDTDATVVHLASPTPPALTPGRFAHTVTDCWRRMDMAGIDAIGELTVPDENPGGFSPDTAAALLAFCRGDPSVTAAEQGEIARTLPHGLPGWAWRELAGTCGRMGFELATAARAAAPDEVAEDFAARCAVLALRDPALPPPEPPRGETRQALAAEAAGVLASAPDAASLADVLRAAHEIAVPVPPGDVERAAHRAVQAGDDLAALLERTPPVLRESVVAGLLTGLEAASPRARRRMLTDQMCDHLEHRDLACAPRTGAAVLRALTLRGRVSRVDATTGLLRLLTAEASGDGYPLNDTAPPAVPEDVREAVESVLEEVWEEAPELEECSALLGRLGPGVSSSPCLCDLPARVYLACGMADPGVVRLAETVHARVPGYPAADARAVLLAAAVPDAPDPAAVASVLRNLDALTSEAHEDLIREALTVAAASLTTRAPRFRADVVVALPPALRTPLARAWLDGKLPRDEQVALAETAVRLHHAGVTVPSLDSWARSRLTAWSLHSSVESRLRRDEALTPSLREMSRGRRSPPWKREAP